MHQRSARETRFIIARNIRYRRMALGMTQSDLGSRVFLCNTALYKKEHGKSSFAAENLPLIAEALKVDVRDLFEAEKFYRE